jgi:hypothetical protein
VYALANILPQELDVSPVVGAEVLALAGSVLNIQVYVVTTPVSIDFDTDDRFVALPADDRWIALP